MKKAIRNVAIALAVLIAVEMLIPISFMKTSDKGANLDYFPKGLKERIKAETAGFSDEKILKYNLNLAAELLRFTRENALKDGKANCVGYAQLCSNIYKYASQSIIARHEQNL